MNNRIIISLSLLLALMVIAPSSQVHGQKSEGSVSEKDLKKVYRLQDFYSSQLKKSTLPEKVRVKYEKDKITADENAAKAVEKRLKYAERVSLADPTLLEKEKFNLQFREMDLALSANESPTVFAHEFKSLFFNLGVSFLSIKTYSVPFTLSGEKVLGEKFSVGGYLGHFVEKVIVDEHLTDSNYYFNANVENYKHNYINIGLKGTYHFFSPTFFLNVEYFDLYVSAMLGYTASTSTFPFLENEKNLPYNSDGNSVDEGKELGQYKEPNKDGINYGVFVGLKYMYDPHLGFFVEAGYSNTAFANIGVSIRILDKNTTVGFGENPIEFKVKIITSTKKKRMSSKSFKGVTEGIEEMRTKKEFIYVMTGTTTSYGAAVVLEAELKPKFRKAEVIAIKEGEIISMKKAMKILKKSNMEPIIEPGGSDSETKPDEKKGKGSDPSLGSGDKSKKKKKKK
ncbi:MAG: hypothetical protein COB85_08260 [Bacteroidetes bacterium]|nr:MAG: hypothetical protein COB85_08260 [Bacteroidota bacterium]